MIVVGRARAPRSTAVWLLVLALAAAAVAWQLLAPVPRAAHDDDGAAAAPLVAVGESGWSSLELLDANGMQRYERDPAGRWLRHTASAGETADHSHMSDPVLAERIASVFAAFSRTRIERTLDPGRNATYGLDAPQLIVLIRGRAERPLLTLEVGQVAADGLSRYVRTPGDGRALMIANYQIEGLLGLARPLPATSAASPPSGPAR